MGLKGEPCDVPFFVRRASAERITRRSARSTTVAVNQLLTRRRSRPSAIRRVRQRIRGPCGIDVK